MIAALVLAAGRGVRMGRSKPLIEINGRPVLELVISKIEKAGITSKTVVLGHGAERIEKEIDLSGCYLVINPHPEEGLSSSLRIGLAAIPADANGVLIFHADMPFIETTTINAVLSAAKQGARIAAPAYAGRRGFPVYFERSLFPRLVDSLSGDSGGRGYIAEHEELVELIEVDDPGCIRDLDRPEDLPDRQGERRCVTYA